MIGTIFRAVGAGLLYVAALRLGADPVTAMLLIVGGYLMALALSEDFR